MDCVFLDCVFLDLLKEKWCETCFLKPEALLRIYRKLFPRKAFAERKDEGPQSRIVREATGEGEEKHSLGRASADYTRSACEIVDTRACPWSCASLSPQYPNTKPACACDLPFFYSAKHSACVREIPLMSSTIPQHNPTTRACKDQDHQANAFVHTGLPRKGSVSQLKHCSCAVQAQCCSSCIMEEQKEGGR